MRTLNVLVQLIRYAGFYLSRRSAHMAEVIFPHVKVLKSIDNVCFFVKHKIIKNVNEVVPVLFLCVVFPWPDASIEGLFQ